MRDRNAGPAKSKQKVLAPTLGASLWLGMPAIRQRFGGAPPCAIHGAGRLNRHPCRFTPQITVRFRPSCLTGRFQIKIKIRIKSADQKTADFVIEKDVRARATAKPFSVNCGSWLACDSINSVCLMYRGVCIAAMRRPDKPVPTEKQLFSVCKSALAFDSTTQVGFQAAVLCC